MGFYMLFLKKGKLGRLIKRAGLLTKNRQTNAVADNVLKKEIRLYKEIAALYDLLAGTSDYPYGREQATECYRFTSTLGDIESMRIVGQRKMEDGKFWTSLTTAIFYDSEVHEKEKNLDFDEAFKFLNTANNHEDVLGKRLLGVLYVNGWGVDADIDKGLKLIIESLDIGNEWQNSSKIFEELGLNKPEFFTKLMAMKGG